MAATLSPTPCARASSSITSMRMIVESMSITISRLLRRSSDSRCRAQSKAPCPAAASSARLSCASSPVSESATSTASSPPSERRWMRSMFAPCAARISATACSSPGPSVAAMTVSAYLCVPSARFGSGLRNSSESPSSCATKSSSFTRACSSSTATANPSVSRPCTTTCSTSLSRAPACASTREMRAVIPGASRPVKVRIISPTRRVLHRRPAGAALSRGRRHGRQALRAVLGGGRGRRLLEDRLDEEEDDQRHDDEVDDPPEEIAVLDGVLPGEHELGIAPLAARQHQPEDRHQHVLHQPAHHLADGGADDDADGQRESVLLEQELPEFRHGLLHAASCRAAGTTGNQPVRPASIEESAARS